MIVKFLVLIVFDINPRYSLKYFNIYQQIDNIWASGNRINKTLNPIKKLFK